MEQPSTAHLNFGDGRPCATEALLALDGEYIDVWTILLVAAIAGINLGLPKNNAKQTSHTYQKKSASLSLSLSMSLSLSLSLSLSVPSP